MVQEGGIMAKKAELERFHRDTISAVAGTLFAEKGIEKTTMDDIAKKAEYSKATLYAYFKSKEEIFQYAALKGMHMLHNEFNKIASEDGGAINQYMAMCEVLANFYEKYPLYFQSMLDTIASDEQSRAQSEVLEAVYQVGESLNKNIENLLQKGVREGVFKEDLSCAPTGFVHWAALSGIVSMAGKKQEYVSQRMGLDKKEIMRFGFQIMLASIVKNGVFPGGYSKE